MIPEKFCLDCTETSCTSPCPMVEGFIQKEIAEKRALASGEGHTPFLEPHIITEDELNKIIGKYGHIFKDMKSKNYFKSYLKCFTLGKIAKLAGCTQQNIQKKFVVWMKKLGGILGKGKYHNVVNPKDFKTSLIVQKEIF